MPCAPGAGADEVVPETAPAPLAHLTRLDLVGTWVPAYSPPFLRRLAADWDSSGDCSTAKAIGRHAGVAGGPRPTHWPTGRSAARVPSGSFDFLPLITSVASRERGPSYSGVRDSFCPPAGGRAAAHARGRRALQGARGQPFGPQEGSGILLLQLFSPRNNAAVRA